MRLIAAETAPTEENLLELAHPSKGLADFKICLIGRS